MTDRLEEAFAKATQLPDDEQDAGARWLMDELESERYWSRSFETAQRQLATLAREALAEDLVGRTEPLDPETGCDCPAAPGASTSASPATSAAAVKRRPITHMRTQRSRPTTLGLISDVLVVVGVTTIDRGAAGGGLHAQNVVARSRRRAGTTLRTLRRGRLPVSPVGRRSDHRRAGRGLRSVHGALVRKQVRDGHRAHHRYEKVDHDAAEWLPTQNRCWFAARVIAVRQRYGLSIDQREADALDQVLAGCASTALITVARGAAPATAAPTVAVPDAIAAWDDNRNGRVSCAEARAHGIAPVTRDHPAYPFMRDGDGDGVVCER